MAERIESLMTLQKELLGDISHELRSPLARLNVALELSRRSAGAGAERSLDRISQEAETLNNLIGQVLDLTRFESGIEGIRMAPVALDRLVKEIAADADFEAQGHKRNAKLLVCEECIMNGNEELLRRAIENVVRNAIKYTAENTSVEISLVQKTEYQNMFAEITVKDKGPGAPEADLAHLFRPFYRVSDARDRQTGGSGLGLAITDRAVILHHGKVTASNSKTGGLVVILQFPLTEKA
ncbi:MAG TPA: ATP-binding protein, partial [Candidatus Wallbacteria bacterium]|nr:ATP-binding protein [Candidatus Wallbacteria bacterium]